jgi:hypothetical protein
MGILLGGCLTVSNIFPNGNNVEKNKVFKLKKYLYNKMKIYFQKYWFQLIKLEPLNDVHLRENTEILLSSLLNKRSKSFPDLHNITTAQNEATQMNYHMIVVSSLTID